VSVKGGMMTAGKRKKEFEKKMVNENLNGLK
jgi:hypothetical protein